MRSPEAIVCEGLVRRFGERAALAGLDLAVGAGETVLITGPNGAGKTTLLRILATVLRPSSGRVAVAGSELPARAADVRRAVGYAGHDPLAYPDLTARENLELSLGPFYWLGLAVVAGLLAYENSIVSEDDLSRVDMAFLQMNGVIAIVFLAGVLADALA